MQTDAIGRPNAGRDWLQKMLDARKTTIDGRPLYQYRVTASEYQELKAILSDMCARCETFDKLWASFRFQVLFVFFATEWWKREYDGGHWRWDDIFSHITTKKLTDKDIARRSDAVRRGLARMQVAIPADAPGHKYFGAIVTNGGLPSKYISTSTSSLGIVGLIGAALKYAIKYTVDEADIYNYIESNAIGYNFPATLQNENMYALIVDVVKKIVELKERYGLDSAPDPIRKLDGANRDWRQEFPILLEDDAIVGLLNKLIKEASRTKVAQRRPLVRRFLDGNPDELFLNMDIAFPTEPVDKDYFVRYFAMSDELPSTFYLNSWGGNQTRIAKVESDLFRPNEYTVASFGAKLPAMDSVILETFSPINDKNVNGFIIQLAERIDPDDPMVFVRDEHGRYTYVASGAASVPNDACWIGMPSDCPDVPAGLVLENTFRADGRVFNLYRCTTDIAIGEYDICLNASVAPKQYVLGGRLLRYRTKPYDAYLGVPQLYYIDEHQNYIKEQDVVYRRHRADRALTIPARVGLIDVCCFKDGRMVCKLPAFVLPPETDFKYTTTTPTSGDVQICHAGNVHIAPASSPAYSASISGDTVRLMSRDAVPPATFWLALQMVDRPGTVNIELPFPASGAGFYDDARRSINDTQVSVNNLPGKRIHLFGLPSGAYLEMRTDTRHFEIPLPAKNSAAEYRLADYDSDIRFLLNETGQDVILTLNGATGRPARLIVSKYDAVGEFDAGTVRISPNTDIRPDMVRLCAVDISAAAPVPLSLVVADDWTVNTDAIGDGVYVVYTPAGAPAGVAPFVWTRDMSPDRDPVYRYIAGEPAEEGGDDAATVQARLMSGYDSDAWRAVEKLVDLFTRHDIPLESVRLWSDIASNPRLLSMFVFRGMFVAPYLVPRPNDKILHKMRDELYADIALIPYGWLTDAATQYRAFLWRALDDAIGAVAHGADNNAGLTELKNKIWARHYNAIVRVFPEMGISLLTAMFAMADMLTMMKSTDADDAALVYNIKELAATGSTGHTINDRSDMLFGKINQMLNPYMSPDGYAGISIPDGLCSAFVSRCVRVGTCSAPLFRFDRYPAARSYVIHFPMFCAWLTRQTQTDYLQWAALAPTLRSFLRFHREYFRAAYRLATLILTEV